MKKTSSNTKEDSLYINENKIPGHGNDSKKIKKNIKMGNTSSNTN